MIDQTAQVLIEGWRTIGANIWVIGVSMVGIIVGIIIQGLIKVKENQEVK